MEGKMGILRDLVKTGIKVAIAPIYIPVRILEKIEKNEILPAIDPHYHDSGMENRSDESKDRNDNCSS
jgi:hypothetical protein